MKTKTKSRARRTPRKLPALPPQPPLAIALQLAAAFHLLMILSPRVEMRAFYSRVAIEAAEWLAVAGERPAEFWAWLEAVKRERKRLARISK